MSKVHMDIQSAADLFKAEWEWADKQDDMKGLRVVHALGVLFKVLGYEIDYSKVPFSALEEFDPHRERDLGDGR